MVSMAKKKKKKKKKARKARKKARKIIIRKARRRVVRPSKVPAAYREVYGRYKNKIMGLVAEFFDQELGVMVEWTRDMLNTRRKMRVMVVFLSLVFGGTAIFLAGLAKYIESLCLTLPPGFIFIVVGLASIAAGLIYKRYVKIKDL